MCNKSFSQWPPSEKINVAICNLFILITPEYLWCVK